MKTTLRAAASVLMLAGFYVLAVALIGGFAGLSVWLWREHPGTLASKVAYVTIVLAAALVVALWKVLRAAPEPPSGLVLTADQAPQLWATTRELAERVGTRPPDEIRLVPVANAWVSEDAKLMGLLAGRRTMKVGMPLIQAFTVAQLRALLAHELGHYSGSHTRLGALAHRGRMTIGQTIQQIGPGSLAGRLFRLYARLYDLVELSVSRRQELEADAAMVRLGGREAAASMLRELEVIGAAWDFYVERYVTVGWEDNLAPQDVFGGFGQLLAARSAELAKLRAEGPPPHEQSRWDSHPPTPERIAAIERMADPGGLADDRPATVLLPDAAMLGARLQQSELDVEGRRLLPWDELVTAAMTANLQRQADVLFRTAARLSKGKGNSNSDSNGSGSGDLGLVLDLVEQGRAEELARAIQPHADRIDAIEEFPGAVAVAITLAAYRSGAGRWRNSWTEGPELVDEHGVELPIEDLARLAAAPATVDTARKRLADAGIALTAARQESASASAVDAGLLGGLANMKSGNATIDVLVLSNGLLLVPAPKSTDHGRRRLRQLIDSTPLTELARANRLVAFEDIASARVLKPVPIRVAITLHNGETIELLQPWTGETLAKGDEDLLREAIAPYVDVR